VEFTGLPNESFTTKLIVDVSVAPVPFTEIVVALGEPVSSWILEENPETVAPRKPFNVFVAVPFGPLTEIVISKLPLTPPPGVPSYILTLYVVLFVSVVPRLLLSK